MTDIKLDTLLMVYEKKSFTKAAEALSLTQPAVSNHISLLEKELGITIFNRSKSSLKTTEEGEIAVKYARRLRALTCQMKEELRSAKKGGTLVRVGITHTAESNFIAEVLARYASENQGVNIKIITDTINNLYDKLSAYELDVAIVEGRLPDEEINSVLLDTDRLMCIISPSHPLSRKSIVSLEDIQKERLLLRLSSSGTQNLFISHLESINMSIKSFNVILEVDNVATIKDLVRKNFGISILARSACLDELKKGKLLAVPIQNLSMIRETNLLYHKDFNHPYIIEELTKLYDKTSRVYK